LLKKTTWQTKKITNLNTILKKLQTKFININYLKYKVCHE